MAATQRKLVHKQFNSPIGMYSDDNVKETLDRELKALSNGVIGIDFNEPTIPANLRNSAVLRMLEEQEHEKATGYKKVRWPPTDANYVKGSTPQPSSYPPQQSEQGSGEHYPQQTAQPQYSQRPNQPQRPADHYPYQQQNTYQQPQHQHANEQPYYQNPQSHPYSAQHQQPNTPYNQQQQQHFPKEPASSTVSFSGGIPVKKPATAPEQNYQPPQYQPLQNYQQQTPKQQYQAQNTQNRVPQPQHYSPQQQSPNVSSTLSPSYQPSAPTYPQSPRGPSPKGWHHVEAFSPARPGYTQPYQYQSGAPASVGSERDLGSYKEPALQQTNKPYAPPHQGYVPLQNQNGRGQSPGVITLRKEAPVSQDPAPIYTSQPAATTYKDSSDFSLSDLGGCNMRGDLKWPPPEYKAQAAAENEERLRLAKEPATRPLRVKKDYSSFFAKHALNSTYPAYKAPPGTQHYPQYAQY